MRPTTPGKRAIVVTILSLLGCIYLASELPRQDTGFEHLSSKKQAIIKQWVKNTGVQNFSGKQNNELTFVFQPQSKQN